MSGIYSALADTTPLVRRGIQDPQEIWEPYVVNEQPREVKNQLNCIRCTTPVFPKSPSSNPSNIPLALLVSPGEFQNVPVGDYTKQLLPNCTSCGATVNVYCTPIGDGKVVRCPICGNSITLTKGLNFKTAPEFQVPVYDIILQKSSERMQPKHRGEHAKEREERISIQESRRNFAIIIDVSKNAISSGFTHRFVNSLIGAVQSAPKYTKFFIITYSDTLVYYDPVKCRELEFPDINDIVAPMKGVRDMPDSREFIISSLEKIGNIQESNSSDNCFYNALNMAEVLFQDRGGVICASISGMPSAGVNKLYMESHPKNDYDIIPFKNTMTNTKYLLTGRRYNKESINLNLITSTDGYAAMNIVGLIPGVSSGTIEALNGYNDEVDKKKVDTFVKKAISIPYFYSSIGNIVMTPGCVHIDNIFSNGAFEDFDNISLGTISRSSSIMYKLTQFKECPLKSMCFQFRLKHIGDDGSFRVRIITQWYPVSDNAEEVRFGCDTGVYALYLGKFYANSLLSMPFDSALAAVQGNGDALIEALIEIMKKSPIFQREHPTHTDGRIADIVRIRNFNVTDFLLYILPRVQCFGPGDCCTVVQDEYSTTFKFNEDCDSEWLKEAMGCESVDKLPSYLSYLGTAENSKFYDFLNRNSHVTGIYIEK